MSQQAKDIERFRWFSQDYIGYHEEKNLVTDVRYSMIPNKIDPMWGLIIDRRKNDKEHAIWWTDRDFDQSMFNTFVGMLAGQGCINSIYYQQK